jgi:hypothetical protein
MTGDEYIWSLTATGGVPGGAPGGRTYDSKGS